MIAISNHLALRRDAIMESWREASRNDPEQTTGDSLTRAQFYDHMPDILMAFERSLAAEPGSRSAASAGDEQTEGEAKHGLHRWQQGFRLREVLREWGHLHLCLHDELHAFSADHPEIHPAVIAAANRRLIKLVNGAVNESSGQYVQLERDAAAGRAKDLEVAITELAVLERQRGELIRQAVHDLGGNVQAVSHAAAVLTISELPDDQRRELANVVKRGVKSLRTMLMDLMGLARLEAGQEPRRVGPVNIPVTLRELCEISQPLARERGLVLQASGPEPMDVQGDSEKILRIAQNLVLNALKYTQKGGVEVEWGFEGETKWWLTVKDSGPGFLGGPGAPLVQGLKLATASARESDQKALDAGEDSTHVIQQDPATEMKSPSQAPGEGIGLSIVKRLCELLDASIEVASAAGEGTTFRVLFPATYPHNL
jgi:signal transduction histidine kinase